jgi:hypothetical protein
LRAITPKMFDGDRMSPRDVLDRNIEGFCEPPAVGWTGSVVPFRNRLHPLIFQAGCCCELGNAHPFLFQEMRHWLHDAPYYHRRRKTGILLGLIRMNPDTDDVPSLIDTIASALERPREITTQVGKHLDGAYGVERDAIGVFLDDKLPKLEDDEHDLILSPLFTPKLSDQAIFAELLGGRSIPKSDWPALIQELVNRPTVAHLVTSEGQTHAVALREVSIERYVKRLRLDGTISASMMKSIDQTPVADHPMLKAVARRAIWESPARGEMLVRLLAQSHSLKDAVDLLRLTEDYQPADSSALLARIPRWIKLLEEEINSGGGPKPFFSQAVQQLHGGDDQRRGDEAKTEAKRSELAFLERV